MANPKDSDDRRKHIRFDRDHIPLTLSEDAARLSEVSLRDIGRGGFGVYLHEKLPPGQVLKFKIGLPGGAVSGHGTVVWSAEHHLGFRAGLKFQSLGWFQAHRLKRYLRPFEAELTESGEPGFSLNLDKVFDTALKAAALLIAAACAAEFMGFDVLTFLGLK